MRLRLWHCLLWLGWACLAGDAADRVPVIDVTDLYHPHQDVGDNLDLIAPYALPSVDLRALVLDVSEGFRKPVADHPGLHADPTGPRDAGFIPVLQLNSIFGRNVPAAVGPYAMMRSPEDKMETAPPFQQQGVELILRVLRESRDKVDIVSFGSARPVAVAYNRDPRLFHRKLRRLHLCAGASEPGYVEWNVALDPHAFVRLLRSDLPVALYPCATREGAFAYGPHNGYWKLENLDFIPNLHPALRRYVAYAFTRSDRSDFLRFLEEDPPEPVLREIAGRPHNVWETCVWMEVASLRLVQQVDGSYRLLPSKQIPAGTQVLPHRMLPCHWEVQASGEFRFTPSSGKSPHLMYDRGDARLNEQALRQALTAWYLSFTP